MQHEHLIPRRLLKRIIPASLTPGHLVLLSLAVNTPLPAMAFCGRFPVHGMILMLKSLDFAATR